MLSQIKTLFLIIGFIVFNSSCQNKKTNVDGIEKKADKVSKDLDEQKTSIESVKKDVVTLRNDLKEDTGKIDKTQNEELNQVKEVKEQVLTANNVLSDVKKNTIIVSERINEGAKLKYIDLLKQENSFQKKIEISRNYLSALFLETDINEKHSLALENFFNDMSSLLTSVNPDINENDILETLNSDIYFFNRNKVSHLDSLKAISISLAEYKVKSSDKPSTIYQLFLNFLSKLPEIEIGSTNLDGLQSSDKIMYANNQMIQFLMHLRLNTYLAVFLNKYTTQANSNRYMKMVKDILDRVSWSSYRTNFVSFLQNENDFKNLKRNLELIKYTFEVNKKLPITIVLNQKIARKIKLIEVEEFDDKVLSSAQLNEFDSLKKLLSEIQAEVKNQIN